MKLWPLSAWLLALLLCGCAERDPIVRLATTTSTHNSGLMDAILPAFEERSGYDVQLFAVGTGQALELGRRGDVDLLLVHARERELEFVEAGHAVDRRDVMWNDFVIVGPKSDPAQIRGKATAVDAFRQIAAAGAIFVSRGDDSGTHMREQALWKDAGLDPSGLSSYLSAGQGQGACLLIADEKQGYILTDRGTWLAYAGRLEGDILVAGDPKLRNPYGAMLVNPANHEEIEVTGARALLDYLTSKDGQQRIAEFRKNGEALFHPMTESD